MFNPFENGPNATIFGDKGFKIIVYVAMVVVKFTYTIMERNILQRLLGLLGHISFLYIVYRPQRIN